MRAGPVRDWLIANTPLEPSLLEGAGFEALVSERLASLHCADEHEYTRVLAHDPREVERLIAGVAVPETWLFRYPAAYEVLLTFAAERLGSGASSLRMRSIGCATGLEPCSMAMTAMHAGWPAERLFVEGIDRSPDAIHGAERAAYGASAIRGEIPAWAVPNLHRAGGMLEIDERVRAVVRYTLADVTSAPPVAPCDVVFCRNLLIYLNGAARARLVGAVCESIVPGGLLCAGHADYAFREDGRLRPIRAPHAFAFERVADAGEGGSKVSGVVQSVARVPAARAIPAHRAVSRAIAGNAPPAREVSLDAARALADAGESEDAEALVREVLRVGGLSGAAMELLGLIRMAADDIPAARACFEQALYLEPSRAASLVQLAIIGERSGQPKIAAVMWERARRAWSAAPSGGAP